MPGMDETGILTDPAEAGALSEITLQDRTGICVPPVQYRTADLFLYKLNQLFHSLGQDIMIIIALGVSSDLTPRP